jgi:hypothetical protein
MAVTLHLDEMTVAEKLAAMELLWDDLSRTPEVIESPEWHKTILEDRRRRIVEGEAQFVDWEKAKAEILKRSREN